MKFTIFKSNNKPLTKGLKMKKLFSILILAILIGCGDDVTNINGYTEEQVQARIDSTLAAQDVMIVNDTVIEHTVDTIYQRVIDTVTHELVDTIYQRVVDTVFTTLEQTGVNIEIPRDTTITLYDTTDNQITAKIYKGIVYKNTFYDLTKYKFNETSSEPINITIFEGWYSTYLKIYSTDRCGLLSNPTWKDFGWEDKDNVRYNTESRYNNTLNRLPGWRLFNAKDANALRDNLDKIITDDSEIYLSTITEDGHLYNFEANVATQYSPNQTSKGKRIKYMCAYDL